MPIKKQFIKDLKSGDRADDIFLLSEKSIRQKKNGDDFLNFTFSDKSGEIQGVAWDNVAQLKGAAQTGDYVHVMGGISNFKEKLQLTVKSLVRCEPDAVNPADFMPQTRQDVNELYKRLREKIDKYVQDEFIHRLIFSFLDDPEFEKKLKTAPAAKKMHHAYLGGLLEHTYSMVVLAERIAWHYRGIDLNLGLNLGLLVAGVFFHDIGKLREFEYETVIRYSDEGKLISHIVIGCMMVDEKIREIENFPPETAMLIKHMIVSHHGTREFGAPEPPKIIEAVLLNLIDNIDAKMNGLREFIAKEDPKEAWTSYNYMLGSAIYKGINEDL